MLYTLLYHARARMEASNNKHMPSREAIRDLYIILRKSTWNLQEKECSKIGSIIAGLNYLMHFRKAAGCTSLTKDTEFVFILFQLILISM